MIRVKAPSRLHFGLLGLANEETTATAHARSFGSVGLMVHEPGVQVAASPACEWQAEGPLATRALAFGRKFASAIGTPHAARLVVERCGREHAGLGVGTQLGLAVARALTAAWELGDLDQNSLAGQVGRGARSAIGIHGFACGGFLVDGGKRGETGIAPLVARMDFPEDWPIILVVPAEEQGIHGSDEKSAFAHLARGTSDPGEAETLCRLVLLGLLPALVERDLGAFGEALHELNARVGRAFAPVQGGTYASLRIGELVAFLRGQGIRGAGQSSWGPAVFGVAGDIERAHDAKRRLCSRFNFADEEVLVTTANNCGAVTYPASESSNLGSPGATKGLLSQIGALKDDPHREEMLKEIYAGRGRSEVEGG